MQKKILLVEDEMLLLRLIKGRLEKEKFDVAIAADGKAAIELINEQTFSAIVSDLMIPSISGFDLISQIRKSPLNKHTPTLIVSAMSAEDVITDALEVGADDFLPKPYSLNVMIAKLNKLTNKHNLYIS